MNELCAILGIGGIVLAVVTLIGHGLWLLSAALLRAITGKAKGDRSIFARNAGRFDPGAVTLAHLDQLYARGLIDLETLRRLRSAIQGGRSYTPFDRLMTDKQAIRSAPPPLHVAPLEHAPTVATDSSTVQQPQPPIVS